MDKIPFEDGTLIKKGYVTIDNEQHDVEPAKYTGEVPLSAYNLNKMQDNIETAINEGDCVKCLSIQGNSKQDIREGYNLLNLDATPVSNAGINTKSFKNDIFKIVSTEGKAYKYVLYKIGNVVDYNGKTLTVSLAEITETVSGYSSVRLCRYKSSNPAGGSVNDKIVSSQNKTNSLLIDSSVNAEYDNIGILIYVNENKGTESNEVNITKLQVYEGAQERNYEQYGASPSIDYPSEVESVGDNIQLFDVGTSIDEYFATDSNGTTIDKSVDIANYVTANFIGSRIEISNYVNTGYRWISKLIELEKNTDYVINGEFPNIANICGFSSLDNDTVGTQLAYINSTNKRAPQTFNSGDYNYYVLSIYPVTNSYIDKIKIEKGTTATSYSPYGQGSIEIKNTNKNQLKVTATSSTVNGITFTVNKDGSILANGTSTAEARLLVQKVTSYPANDYILSDEANGSSSTYFTRLYSGSTGYNTIAQTVKGAVKYTLDEKTDIRTYIVVKSGVTVNNVILKPMIRLASDTDTTYIKGQSQAKALYTQQPLRSIGDIRDKFVKKNGVWYEEHNIGQVILDGTENFIKSTTYSTDSYSMFFLNNDAAYARTVISNMFKYMKYDKTIEETYITSLGNSINIVISNDIIGGSTVDLFKSKLSELYNAGTPVYVDYILATPEFIECTPEQVEALSNIASAYGEGMTNIICNDDIESVIEIEKDTKETVQANNDIVISMLLKRVADLEAQLASTQNNEEGGA